MIAHRHFSWRCTEPKMWQPLTLLCHWGLRGARGAGGGQSRAQRALCHGNVLSNKTGEFRGLHLLRERWASLGRWCLIPVFHCFFPFLTQLPPTSEFSRFYLVVILPAPHGGQRAEQRHSGAAGDRSPPSGAPPPGTELRRTHRGAGRVRCCLSVSRMKPTEAFPSTEGTRGVRDALSAFPAPVSLSSRCPERSFQLKTGKEGGGFEWDSAPPLRARSLRSPRLSAAPAPGLRAGPGCGAAFVPAPWPPPVPRAPQCRGDPTGGAASAHPKG